MGRSTALLGLGLGYGTHGAAKTRARAEAFAARSDTLACINSSTGLSFPYAVANSPLRACFR